MATAIDMYLNQIILVGGIPFSVTLPKAPASINADTMSSDEIHAKLQAGLERAEKGGTRDAREAFETFRGNL